MTIHELPRVLKRIEPTAPPVPVLFDSPHSGADYPEEFRPSAPLEVLRTGEDAFVDELFAAAPSRGAILIHALFPRSFIDANRNDRDIDAALLDGPWPGKLAPTQKTELGLGLIRRLAVPGVPVYDRKLKVAEVEERIRRYYEPYHGEIAAAFDRLHRTFGRVWHINCHSMKSVGNAMTVDAGSRRPDFVLGDRDGTSCAGTFTKAVFDALVGMGYRVTVNQPYKGAELVVRHSKPEAGRHSLQIEINRKLYMDEERITKTSGFAKLQADLTKLIDAVVAFSRSEGAYSRSEGE
ncbi:MAG: N-formylglutamate amidohydrolase [Proteobacteria bacterium]|nr:N-formylglutamate amidohydrolase [Pseudomonadota bacterium]MBI3498971.1 N-formylglutamate amidohydrolase [Pseudomonadota bacterium]